MLTARGLVLAYPRLDHPRLDQPRPVLDGVDLSLAPGELVCLDGPDGCGTSTLLRVLAGQLVPQAGSVQGAAALLEQPPGEDWNDADVAGQLADPCELVRLGMTSPPERELWMLSAGERQRVRLARALAQPAPVLLLDEPLGALDGAGARQVLARLRQQADEGRALLVVAKGDARASRVADRGLELRGGRLQG